MSDDIKNLLNDIINKRADSSRRYVDQILERIEDQNHQYYLHRLGNELRELELAEKAENAQLVMYHTVMADTYRGILEKTFGALT